MWFFKKQNLFLWSPTPRKLTFQIFWAGKFWWNLITVQLLSVSIHTSSYTMKIKVIPSSTVCLCWTKSLSLHISLVSSWKPLNLCLNSHVEHIWQTCYAKPSEEKHSRRNEIRKFLPNEVAYFEKKTHWNAEFTEKLKKTHNRKIERKKEKLRRLKISSHLSFKKLSLAYCAVIYGLRWKFIQIYTDSTSSSNFSHFSAAVAHLFKGRPRVCRRRQSVKKGHL